MDSRITLYKLSEKTMANKTEIHKRKVEHKRLSKIKFDIEPYYSSEYKLKDNIDLITVAFNNPVVIKYQIALIKKFINGDYCYIVCDNSNRKEKSEEIRKICMDSDITYIHVTPKETPNGYSDSHGIALNWIYKNIIKKRGNNFAFLDHDIFPVKKIDISGYLSAQDFNGLKVKPHKASFSNNFGNLWYLWAGFSFFKYNVLKDKNINFKKWRRWGLFKVLGADTGSGNWPVLYSNPKYKNYDFCKAKHCNIRGNKQTTWEAGSNLAQTDLIQYIDDENWLHMINGSEWSDSNGKLNIIHNMLDKFLDR